MKVALVQMDVKPDKSVNLVHADEFIHKAKIKGADMIVLPEMFCCQYQTSEFIKNREPAGGTIWQTLSKTASTNNIWLIGGSFPEVDGEHTFNTSFVFDRDGKQVGFHRKMHLFDIDVKGGQQFSESETFTPGDFITLFDTEFGRMGLCICFDIRFPELCRLMALEGAQVIFCPASFNMTTGPAHWELLFRGRAVENQVFTIGCSSARDVTGPYVSYGHSIAVSPWGDVISRADAEETILYADFNLEMVKKVRTELPLLSARRSDVYHLERNQ